MRFTIVALAALAAGHAFAAGVALSRDGVIYHLPAGAKTPTKIAKGSSPTMSPNGKAVAFLAPDGNALAARKVRVIVLGDKDSRLVFAAKGDLNCLKWSPKGDRMLMLMSVGGKDQIHVIALNGLAETKTSTSVVQSGKNGVDWIFQPRWTPDGQAILFHDNVRVTKVDLAGKVLERTPVEKITGKKNNVDSLGSFTINPANPAEMAYVAMVPGTKKFEQTFGEANSAVFVYNKTTGKRTRLTPADMIANDPMWSSDGKTIYMTGYREPHYKQLYPFRIYRVNAGGTGLAELTKGETPAP